MFVTISIVITILLGALTIYLVIALEKSRTTQKEKKDLDLFMIHELRSPLASIKAAANLIISLEDQLSQDKKRELLKVINSQSIKMLEYISLILDTSKLQSGMFTIQKAPNDIKQVIEDKINLYMPLALEKFITLDIQVKEPIPSFFFDQQYIGQVFSNLLTNSLKFTPENGRIIISAQFDGKNVVVSVSDNGYGLTQEEQAKMFNKFYQGSRTKAVHGTGLGLYFAKSIVEAHGGTISITSVKNEGTTITFTLPFVPAEIKEEKPSLITTKLSS